MSDARDRFNEALAAELEAAADEQDASTNHACDSPHWLRDRAAALRAESTEPGDRPHSG